MPRLNPVRKGSAIKWLTLLVSIANLVALIYVARLNFAQQKAIEEFKKQLVTAQPTFSYVPESGDIIVSNKGNTTALGMRITIFTRNKTLTPKPLQGDIIVYPNQIGDTQIGGKFYVFDIERMAPGQDFAIRINNDDNKDIISHPARSDIDVRVSCTNCTGLAQEE